MVGGGDAGVEVWWGDGKRAIDEREWKRERERERERERDHLVEIW